MSTYNVDLVHSEIAFTVRHMMFAKVRGQFEKWSAALAYDEADPTRSKIRVEVGRSQGCTSVGSDAHPTRI